MLQELWNDIGLALYMLGNCGFTLESEICLESFRAKQEGVSGKPTKNETG